MKFINKRAEKLKQGAIRAMFDRAVGLDDVISMGIGEPDMKTPDEICEAAVKALHSGNTHYTPNAGTLDCRKAISKFNHNNMYDPKSEIIVTPGGMGALSLALSVLLDEDDEVIIQDPQWLNYAGQIQFFGGTSIPVPAWEKNGFIWDPKDIEQHITKNTKVIMVNSPNNPTGKIIPQGVLQEIANIAIKYDLLVISDEVYNTLYYEEKPISISSLKGMKGRTLVINSMSKCFAMTGWRLGYAAGPSEIIQKMVQAQENMSACANSIAQESAVYALAHPEFSASLRETFAKRRQLLLTGLEKIKGISLNVPDGAFYVFANIKAFGLSSYDFCMQLLDSEKVVCIPGSAFGEHGEGYIRIAYTCSEDNVHEAVLRIQRFCECLGRDSK